MSHVVSLTPSVFSRLETLAVGFDTPSQVIERLLNHYDKTATGRSESEPRVTRERSGPTKRLFSNLEIEKRVSSVASTLSSPELEPLCQLEPSKQTFGIHFPLLIKAPVGTNEAAKRKLVRPGGGPNRWTWKYEFQRDGYLYATCTQWYERNDPLVEKWLSEHE